MNKKDLNAGEGQGWGGSLGVGYGNRVRGRRVVDVLARLPLPNIAFAVLYILSINNLAF